LLGGGNIRLVGYNLSFLVLAFCMIQVERFACLYTSQVSNLGLYSPHKYYRPSEDFMPHEFDIINSLVKLFACENMQNIERMKMIVYEDFCILLNELYYTVIVQYILHGYKRS
jgi:hypothetical protein